MELYKLSVSLQGSFTAGITGLGEDIGTVAAGIVQSLQDAATWQEAAASGVFGGIGMISSPIFMIFLLILMGYAVIKVFFANLKRGGILLIQIAVQERYGEHEQVEQSGQGEESIEDARTAIEEAKSERREQAESDGTEAVIPELPPEQENPLEVVHAIKQNALLGMTLGDFGAVSTRQTDLGDSIERRQKQTGNMEIQVSDWYDRILALEYMDQYFGDYLGESEDHALAYELEYVLAGKGSDKENLESVIKRLLFVREAANITHILGDGDKRAKTLGMAEALAGFTGNPAVVRLVQTGVIAAWAYVESILDIRALLAGDKIALIKTETQWTAQFGSLAAAFEDGKKAKNCENGVSYQGYLKGFLYTVSSERLAYRMMDIMERTVRLHPMYADCRMDHVLCGISYRMDYEWQPLFSGLMVHTGRDLSGLCYQTQRTFSYD